MRRKKPMPKRKVEVPPSEETSTIPTSRSRPGVRVRHCRDCGKPTPGMTHVRCIPCNSAHQQYWDEIYASTVAEEKKRGERRSKKTTIDTGPRAVLVAYGPAAEKIRRVAMKTDSNLSEVTASMVDALTPDSPKPKRPSIDKSGERAVLVVQGDRAEKVREVAEKWGFNLTQLAACMVNALKEK